MANGQDHVAQPPSAGETGTTPPRAGVPHRTVLPQARPGKMRYRRNLPHLQADAKTIFLTFCTHNHLVLPESVRTEVLSHCLHDDGAKIHVHGVVVMPDHVHRVFTPLSDANGCPYTLAEVSNSIKGASAHTINRVLNRRGPVWQDESFDHVLRREEVIAAKVQYICENPIRKGLCQRTEEYPWLYVAGVSHVAHVAQPPPAGF